MHISHDIALLSVCNHRRCCIAVRISSVFASQPYPFFVMIENVKGCYCVSSSSTRLPSEHHACCCLELTNHDAPSNVNLKPQLSSELRLSFTSLFACLYAFAAELAWHEISSSESSCKWRMRPTSSQCQLSEVLPELDTSAAACKQVP